MTAIGTCAACQRGDHANHVRVIQAVPEGVYGGVVCPCAGECMSDDRFAMVRGERVEVLGPTPKGWTGLGGSYHRDAVLVRYPDGEVGSVPTWQLTWEDEA